MSFIWDRNTGKIGPARIKASLEPSYTLAELTTLAQRFLQQSPLTDKLAPELILSSYLIWLAKREQGEVSNGKSST